jgi:hypothetical protein
MRGSRGSLLARSGREGQKGSSRSGRHFGIGRLSAIGNGRPPECCNPLELAEAGFRRRRALLRIPRDRLLRRRAVRSGLPVVQGPLPAATPAGPGAAHHSKGVGGELPPIAVRLQAPIRRPLLTASISDSFSVVTAQIAASLSISDKPARWTEPGLRIPVALERRSFAASCRRLGQLQEVRLVVRRCRKARRSRFVWKACLGFRHSRGLATRSSDG